MDPKLNRSVAFQIWAIGCLAPLAVIVARDVGAYDFSAFWNAAQNVWAGNAYDVYNSDASKQFSKRWGLGGPAVFPYPPHTLFLFLPLALIPYLPAYLVWNALTAAFFCWMARPYLPEKIPAVVAILTPAALTCLDFGQTGLLFGGLWLLAFRGKWPAVALLTFKPHLGILSVLSLRRWRDVVAVIALTLLLVIGSMVLFGPTVWIGFLEQSAEHAGKVGTYKRWLFGGVGPAIPYGFWGWLPFAAIGALLLVRRINAFTASTASFLIAPYGFHYDMTVACLGFGLLIFQHWHIMPIRHRVAIASGFLAPVISLAGAWWIPLLLSWALWVQTKYAPETREGTGIV